MSDSRFSLSELEEQVKLFTDRTDDRFRLGVLQLIDRTQVTYAFCDKRRHIVYCDQIANALARSFNFGDPLEAATGPRPKGAT